MNVLHVHSGNMFGGVERMLETLAPAVSGVTPVHSAFALCFDGRTADALERAGGTVHRLAPVRARRVDEVWRARRALRAVLRTGAWDAVCVHSAWSQGLFGPTVIRSGLPLVRWLHAPEPGPRWMEAWSARSRPSLVICNSRYTQRASGGRFGRTPVSVCHPPSRPPTDRPGARAAIRRRLGTPAGAIVIVMAARMEAWKGHRTLLESAALLPDRGWELWIAGGAHGAGEQAYLDALKAQGSALGERVRFVGEQHDVEAWLQAADVYCQPNRGPEPFGLAFVEALSAGLPVVTSAIGAAPEIVDATCGVLTAPDSAPAVAAALKTLIDDDAARARLSAGARVRAREFCDLPRALARLAEAFGQVGSASLVLT